MKAILNKIVLLTLILSLVGAVTANAKFVPSIEQKGAPEVLEAIDAEGNDVTSWIVVTPYSKRNTLDSEKHSVFVESYQKADSERFYTLIKNSGASLPVRDAGELVVTDLFNVHEFEDRGMISLPVTVRLDTRLPAHGFAAVFEFVDGQWQLIPAAIHADGSMTITVSQWGPFAIVTSLKHESSKVPSPQTGVDAVNPLVVFGMVGLGAAAVLVLRKRHAA